MADKKKIHHRIVLWLWYIGTAFYFIILSYTVFFAGRRQGESGTDPVHGLRLNPVVRKWEMWQQNTDLDALYLDVMGNIVMFVPLPLALYVVFRIKNLYLILLLGFLTSFFIETIQYVFHIGVTDVDDLLLNTIGTMLGVLIIEALKIVLADEIGESR